MYELNNYEDFKSKNPFKSVTKSISKGVNKATKTIFGSPKKKKKSSPPPPKPIVYALANSNFNNDMYYDIFCPYSGYKELNNKSFNKTDSIITKNVNNSIVCQTDCTTNPVCTSYSFNKSTKDCTLYKGFPSSVSTNNSIDSGIKTNGKYSYNNLNSTQKTNIQKHCINKKFQLSFGKNDLDIRSCFNQIKNNKNDNYVDLNAQCVWNNVNTLGKGLLINKSERVNNNKIGGTVSSKSMDKYQTDYTNYLTNLQGYFDTEQKLSKFDDKFNSYNTMNNANIDELKNYLNNSAIGTIALSKLPQLEVLTTIGSDKELFENQNQYENIKKNSKAVLCIIILLIIVLFIFYLKK